MSTATMDITWSALLREVPAPSQERLKNIEQAFGIEVRVNDRVVPLFDHHRQLAQEKPQRPVWTDEHIATLQTWLALPDEEALRDPTPKVLPNKAEPDAEQTLRAIMRQLGLKSDAQAHAVQLCELSQLEFPQDQDLYLDALDTLLYRLEEMARELIDVPVPERFVEGDSPQHRLRDLLALYQAFFQVWPMANDLRQTPMLEPTGEQRRQLEFRIDALGDYIIDELSRVFGAPQRQARFIALRPRNHDQRLRSDPEIRTKLLRHTLRMLDGSSGARFRSTRGAGIFQKIGRFGGGMKQVFLETTDIAISLIIMAGHYLSEPSMAHKLASVLEVENDEKS